MVFVYTRHDVLVHIPVRIIMSIPLWTEMQGALIIYDHRVVYDTGRSDTSSTARTMTGTVQ